VKQRVSHKKHLMPVIPVVVITILVVWILWWAAGREMEAPKAWKHATATAAAVLGVLASARQGRKSHQRAKKSEDALEDTSSPAASIHSLDAVHFRSVGTMWFVVAAGAALAFVAETIDFFID